MPTNKLIPYLLASALLVSTSLPARPQSAYVEPPVFSSKNGLLDILMIAKEQAVPTINFKSSINPMGWVYEICYRVDAGPDDTCNPHKSSSDWGGIRLALQKGDLLKVRLVNRLPTQNPDKVSHYWNMANAAPTIDTMGINLPMSETNIHTHGLVVQARAPTKPPSAPWWSTWGDDIYVALFHKSPPAPAPYPIASDHGAIVYNDSGVLDYAINLPYNIPSGLDWYHSHIHGYSADGLAHGLAGLITIGGIGDYVFGGMSGPSTKFPENQVKYITLKDIQVLAQTNKNNPLGSVNFQKGSTNWYGMDVSDGEVLSDQQDPMFCLQNLQTVPVSTVSRPGSCPGINNSTGPGPGPFTSQSSNYTGGQWYFPINGMVYPTLNVNDASGGEIWRISNYSSSATYKLELDSVSQPSYAMLTQLISVDGVSIHAPAGGDTTQTTLTGGKYTIVPCPGASALPSFGNFQGSAPVCVKDFIMTPGSRAEVYVTYRDRDGKFADGDGKSAIFKTTGYTTGIPNGAGDPWPQVDLAQVNFTGASSSRNHLAVVGEAYSAAQQGGIFHDKVPYAQATPLPYGCAPLQPGTHRRVYFGLVNTNNPNIFGAGYETVRDSDGTVVGPPAVIKAFDPSNPNICLPLAAGQYPVKEIWDVVNLGTEDHNFHIHQTRFRILQLSATSENPVPISTDPTTGAVYGDTALLKPAAPISAYSNQIFVNQNGYCSIDDWKLGKCTNTPAKLEIPFAELGEFVYHCHILEHEDSGMMAKIQVVASPTNIPVSHRR